MSEQDPRGCLSLLVPSPKRRSPDTSIRDTDSTLYVSCTSAAISLGYNPWEAWRNYRQEQLQTDDRKTRK